jgi:D-galactarolactone cycloisomerase
MKITAIETILVGIPYRHDAPKVRLSTGAIRELMDAVYIKVETDTGIIGWGEAHGFGACTVTHAACNLLLEPLAKGAEADDIPALMTDLFRRTQGMSLNGPVRNALSGLEIALWDIKGKAEGKPIWKLLGGDGAKTLIPAYASLLRTGKPEHVIRLCTAAAGRGYRHIKVHERNEVVVDSMKAARQTVGDDIDLMLDTNCAWLPDQVIDWVRALEPIGLKWLEEPVYPPDDFTTMARIRAETGMPVAAGENLGTLQDFVRMIDAGAVDFAQPDVTKFGGIAEMMKAVAIAENRGARIEPHSPMYGPGLISTLHIIAAMKDDAMCEYYFSDLAESPLGDWAIPKDGHLRVPDGPGLGVEVDEDIIGRHRIG